MSVFSLITSYFLFSILAINGKIFGNLHGLIMNEDTMTNWYLLGLGSEVDIHTIHYHAESFLFKVSLSKMLWERHFEWTSSVDFHCEIRGLFTKKACERWVVNIKEWNRIAWLYSSSGRYFLIFTHILPCLFKKPLWASDESFFITYMGIILTTLDYAVTIIYESIHRILYLFLILPFFFFFFAFLFPFPISFLCD